MIINVSYISTKWYDRTNITQWMWWFERYRYIRGFKMRIFGVYINVRENNATQKLIDIANGKRREKEEEAKRKDS